MGGLRTPMRSPTRIARNCEMNCIQLSVRISAARELTVNSESSGGASLEVRRGRALDWSAVAIARRSITIRKMHFQLAFDQDRDSLRMSCGRTENEDDNSALPRTRPLSPSRD